MNKTLTSSNLRIWAIVIGILVILSGCKSSKKEEADTTYPAEDQTAKEAVIEELSGYPIPTSFEITEMLHKAGASYILAISNAAGKVGTYISSVEKALNLGVYGTDLSYASTYRQMQETKQYLESSKRLIDELEISTAFVDNYAERVENNLNNRDSLIIIISDSFYDTWNYLVQNEKDKLAILVVVGAWIEGLYIATNIAITAEDNTNFLEIIARQKNSLDKLIEIVNPLKDDQDMTELHKGLMDLSKIFQGVEETLTDEQIEKVLRTVEPLRNSMV
jgi:hypothetical protein